MTYSILNSLGSTVNVAALSINAGTVLPQSVPTYASGSTMIGSAVMAAALPVTIATDQANFTVSVTALPSGSNAIGTVSALQTGVWTVAVLALPSGTNAIGTVSVTGTPNFNILQVGSQPVATAGVNGALAIGGIVASAASVGGVFPLLIGGRTQTGEIASTSTGQSAFAALDKVGKLINLPFANTENFTTGAATSAATTAVQIIASTNATNRLYITAIQLSNTGASTIIVTLNDPVNSNFIAPAGGGSDLVFPTPLKLGLGSALLASCSLAVSTVYINAQGFFGQ